MFTFNSIGPSAPIKRDQWYDDGAATQCAPCNLAQVDVQSGSQRENQFQIA